MGFFKKDKSPSDAQHQQVIQQQQQQLVAAQTQVVQSQSTINQLGAEVSEQTRLMHLYRTESANLQAELQNARRQLQSTQGNLNAEVIQRQALDRRLQESDLANTILVSTLEAELRSCREVAEQERRQNLVLNQRNQDLREELRALRQQATRTSPQLNGGHLPQPEAPAAGNSVWPSSRPAEALFPNPRQIAELPADNGPGFPSGHRVQVRQSQPQLRPPPQLQTSPLNPFRPASTTGTRNSSSVHLPSAGIITPRSSGLQVPPPYQANPPSSSSTTPTPVAPSQRGQTPTFIVPPIRSPAPRSPEPITEQDESDHAREDESEEEEEAQHRRAILESAEISRYEERVRAAEASREQMQAQFTVLSGEVATLKKRLEEKDRELFVRDNQLEWMQQRAAALVRGEDWDGQEDGPFPVG